MNEKTENHTIKTCDDIEGWQKYMDAYVTPILNEADQDLKEAARRIQANKAAKPREKKNDKHKGADGADDSSGQDNDMDEDDDL